MSLHTKYFINPVGDLGPKETLRRSEGTFVTAQWEHCNITNSTPRW